jgi:hypothetical protein
VGAAAALTLQGSRAVLAAAAATRLAVRVQPDKVLLAVQVLQQTSAAAAAVLAA